MELAPEADAMKPSSRGVVIPLSGGGLIANVVEKISLPVVSTRSIIQAVPNWNEKG
jgi:hypothetical protein